MKNPTTQNKRESPKRRRYETTQRLFYFRYDVYPVQQLLKPVNPESCYIARIILLFDWLGIILTPAFQTIENTQSKYHSDPSINSKRKEHSPFLRCFVIDQLKIVPLTWISIQQHGTGRMHMTFSMFKPHYINTAQKAVLSNTFLHSSKSKRDVNLTMYEKDIAFPVHYQQSIGFKCFYSLDL